MSNVALHMVRVKDGVIERKAFPVRPDLKLEFIGDSITCGYGVLGEPMSAFTLREEDGMLSYAQVAADLLHARARFVSASGYGAYVGFDGDLEENVPKLYPYVNWFADRTVRCDYKEYEPDVVIINLGTNDSWHMDRADIRKGFVRGYAALIRMLKDAYPDTRILCICGTLCTTMFEWIEAAVSVCREEGKKELYVRRLPYHNVMRDGMACQHPSRVTHQKDGVRVAEFIREILNRKEDGEERGK